MNVSHHQNNIIQGLSLRMCFLKRLSDGKKYLIHELEAAHNYYGTFFLIMHHRSASLRIVPTTGSWILTQYCAHSANNGNGARDIITICGDLQFLDWTDRLLQTGSNSSPTAQIAYLPESVAQQAQVQAADRPRQICQTAEDCRRISIGPCTEMTVWTIV